MQGEGGGAPTKYKTSYNKQAYKLCLLGATDAELGDFFEVTETTIHNWKLAHPKFFESIKKGKVDADANVAASLYKRALGYEYTETTFEQSGSKEVLEATGDELMMKPQYTKKVTRKQQAGDTTAQIFWLKNRNPNRWRDKQEVDHTTKGESINKPVDMSLLTDDEVRAMAAIQRKLNGA